MIIIYQGYNKKIKIVVRKKDKLVDSFNNTYIPPIKPNWYMNIPTSYSYPREEYKQVGILTYENQMGNIILALFGRPIHRSRNKWQYYTMTDKNRSIKLPIKINGKNGNSMYGVDELYTDEDVYVEGFKDTFKTTIYDTHTLEYF